MILCAKETAGAILGDAGMTILIGLVVVFAVLLLLTGVFKLFGMAMSHIGDAGEEKAPAGMPPAPSVPVFAPIVGNTQPVTTVPGVQNGIAEETVAVISAAVAMMAPAGTQYAVAGIRKAASPGNTQPVTTVPGVQNGIAEETVAVISAAVASVAPAGMQYAVAGIRKKED